MPSITEVFSMWQHNDYEVIWESNSWFYNQDGNNSTKTVSPRLMPDVQYVYIQKLAKCFLIFENPSIILKSIIFIFINSISIYYGSFKAVGILMIFNGVYDEYFWILFWNVFADRT